MAALEDSDPEKAASVCAENVRVILPGGDNEVEGRAGVRNLIKLAPPFVRRVREEQVLGDTVILKGLTRNPGVFTNFTTWTFETDGRSITRVTFAWKPAN